MLRAYLTAGRGDGRRLSYGGGVIEEWQSQNGGETWQKVEALFPEGNHLYNNPRFVERPTGGVLDDYMLFYGWPGGSSIQQDDFKRETGAFTGKAYLWHGGEFMGNEDVF